MKKETFKTEVLDVTVESIDRDGRGIANYRHAPEEGSNGKKLRLYIRNTVPGDKVRVTVENAKGRKKAVVDYDELLEAGPTRNMNIPESYARTGGVPLVNMTYEAQIEMKENAIKKYLAEKDFDTSLVLPTIGMENHSRYRNKMELTFGTNGEIGMHQQGNFRRIIDMEDSILAPEIMVEVKHEVSAWQKAHNLSGYNKDEHEGLLRNLMMRVSFQTGELMVAVYATEAPEKHQVAVDDLIERLSEKFPELESLMWIEYAGIVDRIQTDASHTLYGREYINDELNGFRYRIYQDTFFQANPVAAELMVEIAMDLADVDADMRVLDLFCGVGTFTLPLAKRAKEVAGIEIVETSIESAKRNARDNGIDNTHFIVSDARHGLTELTDTWGIPDLLLLDPPRSGAGGKVMRSIGRFGTEKIVYVSCNPKTLAEDMVWLKDFGYELKSVQPIDQFPHTTHVECIVLMEKVK